MNLNLFFVIIIGGLDGVSCFVWIILGQWSSNCVPRHISVPWEIWNVPRNYFEKIELWSFSWNLSDFPIQKLFLKYFLLIKSPTNFFKNFILERVSVSILPFWHIWVCRQKIFGLFSVPRAKKFDDHCSRTIDRRSKFSKYTLFLFCRQYLLKYILKINEGLFYLKKGGAVPRTPRFFFFFYVAAAPTPRCDFRPRIPRERTYRYFLLPYGPIWKNHKLEKKSVERFLRKSVFGAIFATFTANFPLIFYRGRIQ